MIISTEQDHSSHARHGLVSIRSEARRGLENRNSAVWHARERTYQLKADPGSTALYATDASDNEAGALLLCPRVLSAKAAVAELNASLDVGDVGGRRGREDKRHAPRGKRLRADDDLKRI